MVDEAFKKRASNLVKKAKEKGLIKTYKEFCKTNIAKKTALSKKEAAYYTSMNKGDVK